MSNKIIVLDPGHGQFGNPHTTRQGFYEGTQNFILATHLREMLLARGFDVRMTRECVEDNPSLEERGRMAGELGAVMFLSIHSNAPGARKSETVDQQINLLRILASLGQFHDIFYPYRALLSV